MPSTMLAMQLDGFLRLIENVANCDDGSVKMGMALEDVPGWDSLSVVEFMADVDSQLGVRVQPSALSKCRTVDDLVALVGDKVEK